MKTDLVAPIHSISHRMSFSWLVPVCYLLVSLGVFFRRQLSTGRVFGDRTDGLIEVTHLEHWNNVVSGWSWWNRTFYFYPSYDTIGYNDSYLAFGLIHAVFRQLGIGPFLASDLTDVLTKSLGFLFFYAAGKIVFQTGTNVTSACAAIFTLWSTSYANAYHQQLFSVSYEPIVFLAVFLFVRAAGAPGWRPYGCGAVLALLIGVWAMTAFYTLWFSAYFSFFLMLTSLVIYGRQSLVSVAGFIRVGWRHLMFYIGAQAVCLLPFWRVYHYTSQQTGGHSFDEVRTFLPSFLGILDTGAGSPTYLLTLGRLAHRWPQLLPNGEQVMGVCILTFCAFVALSIRSSTRHGCKNSVCLVATAVLVSWLCTIQIDGHTVWGLFYDWFPAAKAVRVISRYELFLSFPITLVIMLCVTELLRKTPSAKMRLSCVALLSVLVAEQYNTSYPVGLSVSGQDKWLAGIPAPPSECQSFYAVGSRKNEVLVSPGVDRSYGNNVDAMFLAEMIHLPTLNGMDSFTPRGWNLVGYRDADYTQRVLAFIRENRLSHVCALNLANNRWAQ
ncbi:hypothetical protein NFI95_04415 [Acetobacteraceae bacterium KSS8]|uniref:Glycosyltransferase RgtA/B/C/D-like domain-containing protein n=1 Tax=Endosaccharibacter trunci TaxID=2812733 RepID=A0ABT1W479_9PROT|nr:hypothetical protein [Acetobacteraceae bacterium KSS8]